MRGGIEWNLRLFGRSDAPALQQARQEFEALLERRETRPLTEDWIEGYEQRRTLAPRAAPIVASVPDELPPPPPEPHEVQLEALRELRASVARGERAGLVVMATGLGKTYLAAFFARAFRRVLFVAHRDEILAQARSAFRRVLPEARLGRYAADRKEVEADVLFAWVQTLSRPQNLQAFAADAFDCIVIDEFHHAVAPSYRRVIGHFEPRYLLGLTATPERMDGGDLLGLCQENLVYRCDLWDGIQRGLLAPFHYFGVPDDVEYSQIPWRSNRFDPEELTAAKATAARAENALEQLRRRGGRRALGFCVSIRHAD